MLTTLLIAIHCIGIGAFLIWFRIENFLGDGLNGFFGLTHRHHTLLEDLLWSLVWEIYPLKGLLTFVYRKFNKLNL